MHIWWWCVCYHIYRNGNSFHIERYAAGEMERIYPSFWDTNQLISVDSWLPTETVNHHHHIISFIMCIPYMIINNTCCLSYYILIECTYSTIRSTWHEICINWFSVWNRARTSQCIFVSLYDPNPSMDGMNIISYHNHIDHTCTRCWTQVVSRGHLRCPFKLGQTYSITSITSHTTYALQQHIIIWLRLCSYSLWYRLRLSMSNGQECYTRNVSR